MDDETREEVARTRRPRADRYVTVYLGPTEIAMMETMQEKLGVSRSGLVRAAIQSYTGVVARLVK